jgi:hypothetical protein
MQGFLCFDCITDYYHSDGAGRGQCVACDKSSRARDLALLAFVTIVCLSYFLFTLAKNIGAASSDAASVESGDGDFAKAARYLRPGGPDHLMRQARVLGGALRRRLLGRIAGRTGMASRPALEDDR